MNFYDLLLITINSAAFGGFFLIMLKTMRPDTNFKWLTIFLTGLIFAYQLVEKLQ